MCNRIYFNCCIAKTMIHIQLYTYTCGNIVNTIMTNEHTFLEKYTAHTLFERVMCERWVGDWTKTATFWPPVPLSLAALLSRSAGLLNQGSWGPIALCWVLVLSTASYFQLTDSKLTELVCGSGLYNCLTSTCFLWALHLHPIQQSGLYPDIFDRMHLFFDWWLGRRSVCYKSTYSSRVFQEWTVLSV